MDRKRQTSCERWPKQNRLADVELRLTRPCIFVLVALWSPVVDQTPRRRCRATYSP